MKFIKDQIKVVMSAIKLEKPIIKLVKGYDGDIKIELNNKPIFDSEIISSVDEQVVETMRYSVCVKLSLNKKCYHASVDSQYVVNQILFSTEQKIMKFLRNKGGFANNCLSKIYRWYNKKIIEKSIRTEENLAQDLYNIVKFTEGSFTEEQVKTARILYALIKDRYEPILGSI